MFIVLEFSKSVENTTCLLQEEHQKAVKEYEKEIKELMATISELQKTIKQQQDDKNDAQQSSKEQAPAAAPAIVDSAPAEPGVKLIFKTLFLPRRNSFFCAFNNMRLCFMLIGFLLKILG